MRSLIAVVGSLSHLSKFSLYVCYAIADRPSVPLPEELFTLGVLFILAYGILKVENQ